MEILIWNTYLISEFLSNIELFYTSSEFISENKIHLCGEEFNHAVKVMRYKSGDKIYITNGAGKINKCLIQNISKEALEASIIDSIQYQNKFEKIIFCLPKLKNPERVKFSIEKCVELGVTNFVLVNSDRTISKNNNIDRWNKIALAAMKQSLRSFMPNISMIGNLDSIAKLPGEKIIFEQNSQQTLASLKLKNEITYFIFGPEGGFSERELNIFDQINIYRVARNRLRSETAVIFAASFLNQKIE